MQFVLDKSRFTSSGDAGINFVNCMPLSISPVHFGNGPFLMAGSGRTILSALSFRCAKFPENMFKKTISPKERKLFEEVTLFLIVAKILLNYYSRTLEFGLPWGTRKGPMPSRP